MVKLSLPQLVCEKNLQKLFLTILLLSSSPSNYIEYADVHVIWPFGELRYIHSSICYGASMSPFYLEIHKHRFN